MGRMGSTSSRYWQKCFAGTNNKLWLKSNRRHSAPPRLRCALLDLTDSTRSINVRVVYYIRCLQSKRYKHDTPIIKVYIWYNLCVILCLIGFMWTMKTSDSMLISVVVPMCGCTHSKRVDVSPPWMIPVISEQSDWMRMYLCGTGPNQVFSFALRPKVSHSLFFGMVTLPLLSDTDEITVCVRQNWTCCLPALHGICSSVQIQDHPGVGPCNSWASRLRKRRTGETAPEALLCRLEWTFLGTFYARMLHTGTNWI